MVGDLVNRGPDSLAVLRWARDRKREMGRRFQAVLGNHDLHLTARSLAAAPPKPHDTLAPLLAAPDGPELVEWLRRRPFAHAEQVAGRSHLLVHAGLPPGWSQATVLETARRLERTLRSDKAPDLLRHGKGEATQPPKRQGKEGSSHALAAFTRMRMLDDRHCLHAFNGPPSEAPAGLLPWFDAAPRACPDHTVVVGHWAALGLLLRPDLVALDTGCVWGGALTAVRLDDRRVVQQPNLEQRRR